MESLHPVFLFGGKKGWSSDDWIASDDRVRGGKSQSYLDCSDNTGCFHGNLDIKTLGGAGFASQRTAGEDQSWDLSDYAGVVLNITEADAKRYTFILKDELLPQNPENGREQATISWEYDFRTTAALKEKGTSLFVPFDSLKPTYRGKEKTNVEPLNLKHIKRISIMNRSFFGEQEGPFSLSLRSIVAVTHRPEDARRLEDGHGSNLAARRWSTLTDGSRGTLRSWTLCGLALIVIGVYYIKPAFSRRND